MHSSLGQSYGQRYVELIWCDTGKEEEDDPQIIELKDSDDYGHMTRIGNTSGDTMASTVKYKMSQGKYL